MRFHLPALPGQPTTRANSSCAYSQKVRKFARMMNGLGHEVFLYHGEPTEPEPGVVSIGNDQGIPSFPAPLRFDPSLREWIRYNEACAIRIRDRMEPGDFLCLIAGRCQEALAAALPELTAVEFGIGYGGVFAPHRVYESRAWMATVEGALTGGDAHAADGRYFDAVIPNYFEVEDFPEGDGEGDYLLYVGRLTARKGVSVAIEVAERLGHRLIVAGEPDGTVEIPEWVENAGSVGPEQRGRLMAQARCLLAPTQYLEPFGGVVAEAQLCGTPAITTDWGAFPELVEQDRTGFRCRSLGEFLWAAQEAPQLGRGYIRTRAQREWSLEAVGPMYERYFDHLALLQGDGWYDATPRRPRW